MSAAFFTTTNRKEPTMTDRLRDRAARGELDDVDDLLAEQMKDPAFAAAYEDAGTRSRLIWTLIQARKASSLTVEQVAERMQVKAKDVRDYEGGATDPRLSFHQRYARAVGLRLRAEL